MTPETLLASLRLPVVAAPMFLVSGPELVVAAARAGILGAFPTQNCRTPEQLDEWLGAITAGAGGAPVGGQPHHAPEQHAARRRPRPRRAAHRPPVVITALGSPRPVMEAVKGYGGLVVADVIDLVLARKAIDAGVDGLACISAGAGGHTGHLSPFAFVSAVRDLFDGLVTVAEASRTVPVSPGPSPPAPTSSTWAPASWPRRRAGPPRTTS